MTMADITIPRQFIEDIDAITEHKPLFGRKAQRSRADAGAHSADQAIEVSEIKVRPSFRWIPVFTALRQVRSLAGTIADAFVRAFRGELSLTWTFWGWGLLYGILIALFQGSMWYLSMVLAAQEWLSTGLLGLGYLVVWCWTVFLSIAIINAARNNRKRGLWGWIATGVAGFSLITLPVQMYQAAYPKLENWQQVQNTVAALNLAAPIKFSDTLLMTEVALDKPAKLITFQLDIALETINRNTFDPVALKNTELEACPDLKIYFESPVETLRFVYNAKDGTAGEVIITDSDCGYAPPRAPTGPTAKA